ncbi:acyl-CoA dehydrogenase [Paracoccus sp. S-4012]|uniref:acyl-CoA dehydrogenase family protein n=1 Tax=Paracoccus sp. S-4012 TaxID=2665648 RepID=UPI0012AEF872|nr:acyl-CoA dehydrogenase family protein [Paracoccus sp. S-4012]MRX48921.1 acyl-CoA dehydrogenase [Paracoccus sp. S-4012]
MDWTLWQWPFFEPRHHEIAERVAAWRSPVHDHEVTEASLPEACREVAASLAQAGFLDLVVPREGEAIDLRAVCLAREGIGYHSALADCVLAMQGIGAGAIVQAGNAAQKALLDGFRDGSKIAAFALTEPRSGSDVAGLETTAARDGDDYVLNGEKAYISNAPFADHYVVLARTGEAPGARGLSAFSVPADTPGLIAGEATALIAAHPAGPLRFDNCRIPASALIGEAGRGFHLAMGVFDTFRTSVGAFSIGLARRAFDETVARVRERGLFGAPMAELAGVQDQIAAMNVEIELGALAVYRAAWAKDTTGGRCTREVSMAKLVGTENAGRAVDRAVQLWGGLGVTRGSIIEQLYREVRAARIYEGASEVQQLVIGRAVLKGAP